MTADDPVPPQTATTPVAATSESDMWTAELLYLLDCDPRTRSAQFAIRTAVRAQATAGRSGLDPIDVLLDARSLVSSDRAREIYNAAIGYLRVEQFLDGQPCAG